MSVEAGAGERSVAVARLPEAAGPVGGGHAALALGLDVAEADRDRAGARVDGVPVDAQLPRGQAGPAGRQPGAGGQGNRPELQAPGIRTLSAGLASAGLASAGLASAGLGGTELSPPARIGSAGAQLAVDQVRGELPVHPGVGRA